MNNADVFVVFFCNNVFLNKCYQEFSLCFQTSYGNRYSAEYTLNANQFCVFETGNDYISRYFVIVDCEDGTFWLKPNTPAILQRNNCGKLFLTEVESAETWVPVPGGNTQVTHPCDDGAKTIAELMVGGMKAGTKAVIDNTMKELVRQGIYFAATNALGAISLGIVGLFLDDVLSSGQKDMSKVLEKVEDVIKRQCLSQVHKVIGNVENLLRNEYEPKRLSRSVTIQDQRQSLFQSLQVYQQILMSQPFQLETDDIKFCMVALPTFLKAAILHLCILQEMAVVDPNCRSMNPWDSSYKEVLLRFAYEYTNQFQVA